MSLASPSRLSEWLSFEALAEKGTYKTTFATHHLGNVFIRSLHGGVTGAMVEMSAEAFARNELKTNASLMIIASSVDYLRITKDRDLYARAESVRLSRRMAVIDVTCWQDDQTLPVARGVVTIKIDADPA